MSLNNKIWQLTARKLSGEASLEELRELERLLAEDPELGYKVDIFSQYFERPSEKTYRSQEEKQQSLEHFRAALGRSNDLQAPGRVRLLGRRQVLRWAAVAAILIMVVAGFFLRDAEKKDVARQQPVNEVNTMRGTRSRMVLPDGTIAWLNSESRLVYNADFGKTKREITLIGEAFFDVAHNEAVPMVVHAKDVNIWVKGTAFNVRSYPESDKVEASLIRGAIELTTNKDPERKILLKPNEKIVLDLRRLPVADTTPGRHHRPAKDGQAAQAASLFQIQQLDGSRFNVIPEISWVQNELVFDNEVLTEVIARMEKWYNVQIILQNQALADKNVSGVFKNEDITEALAALQYIVNFQFEIKGNTVVIK